MKKNFLILIIIISIIMIGIGIYFGVKPKTKILTSLEKSIVILNKKYPLEEYQEYVLNSETETEYRFIIKNSNDPNIYAVDKKTNKVLILYVLE